MSADQIGQGTGQMRPHAVSACTSSGTLAQVTLLVTRAGAAMCLMFDGKGQGLRDVYDLVGARAPDRRVECWADKAAWQC